MIERTAELLPSELVFLSAMRKLAFGRFEGIKVANGELVLDPWPTTVQGVKFGSDKSNSPPDPAGDFALKHQVVELFEYVRSVQKGEIRCLEIRHGLPFAMEIERGPAWNGGRHE